ncbi:MAG: HAD-IA family hydrolase [Nanoarchaeota archaeon]|nr:HAD-IA family hydrolase [Nanoarchaeota archaeon]
MIKGLIWDMGGVIINFDANITNRLLSEDCGRSPEEVNALLYGGSAAGREYNAGLISDYYLGETDSEGFYFHVAQALQLNMSRERFEAVWKATLTTPNIEVVDLIHRLHRRYQQCILSSTNPWQLERMNEFTTIGGKIDLQTLLGDDRMVTTYKVHDKKPSKRLFRAACAVLGLEKELCVYIDDVKKYTDAAKKFGLQAVHVDITKPDFINRCLDDLVALGINVS